MLATILIISCAIGWLLFETKGLTIRLTGKDKPLEDNWTPYYQELLDDIADYEDDELQPKPEHKPSIITFSPLDMPETKGTLNIICKVMN